MEQDLDILFESNQLIAINKPAGLIVEKNPWEASVEDLVWEYLSGKHRKPYLGVIHRLDRVTSGVLLFAKKKSALKALNEQFRNQSIQKTYLAKVSNSPSPTSGTLFNYLEKNQALKKAIIHRESNKLTKDVSLSYQDIGNQILEINPKTGKFHQIRAQLAHIGSPIIGDEKYGSEIPFYKNQICLHAFSLSFKDPISLELMTVKSPIPSSWNQE